ncbi:MAG: hypothetical protein E7Z94_09790 [Actinomyces ruminicola]|nr:hypothetical protein [Actinomyces ruminicola]
MNHVIFSESTYNATLATVGNGIAGINTNMVRLSAGVARALQIPLIPEWLADLLTSSFEAIKSAVSAFLSKVGELLEGAAAPILFYKRAWDWSDDIKRPMVDVSDAISAEHLIDTEYWDGEGYRAYARAVSDQSGAASAVADIGGSMATALTVCATTGLAFYVALGVIIYKCVSVLIASIAAIGSGVFTIPGIAMLAGDIAVTSGEVLAAVSALVAVLATQAGSMVSMKSALDSFPGDDWPSATS